MTRRWMDVSMRRWLRLVLFLALLLTVNAAYLGGVTLLQWQSGALFENQFYQYQFLLHLLLGLGLLLPFTVFAARHAYGAWTHRNRHAVRRGQWLLLFAVLLLISGVLLVRIEGIEIRAPQARMGLYWTHVLTACAGGLFLLLHRLAGRRIDARRLRLALGATAALVIAVFGGHAIERDDADDTSDIVDRAEFIPTLASTKDGRHIAPEQLMNSEYCLDCHADAYAGWQHSVHRFSSFNNPAYFASLRETRDVLTARDGHPLASRFCAGCHDPVMLFSGRFDTVDMHQWTDPRQIQDPVVTAGITCTVCHSITALESPRGNADYHIEAPRHYPFANSESPALRFINRQLIKAKPAFHKRTFLKPLHQSAEFCATCHKVHIPEALNEYRWLRGQNHYDTFLLSGVSGHGVESFYYPPKARANCADCHMPAQSSTDFGARELDPKPGLEIHDHEFAAANTAIPALMDLGAEAVARRERFLKDSVRLDLFAVHDNDQIDGAVIAPLEMRAPVLEAGRSYLVDLVIRTLKLGHPLTQGTADSNELWVEFSLWQDGELLAQSGGRDGADAVDPNAHFVNAYVVDRDGRKIDRRNVQDIFHTLYNNQIPPGAADTVHYRIDLPVGLSGSVELRAALRYRKFTAEYQRYFMPAGSAPIDLPIATLAEDHLSLGVGRALDTPAVAKTIPEWERWNDYGIGLLRKRGNGELRQAEAAFAEVERLGRADGPLNLARVYLREGRLAEAEAALERAARHESPAWPWSILWLTAQINHQNGATEQAIDNLQRLLDSQFPQAVERGFDFSKDYRVLNLLGEASFEQARRPGQEARRDLLLKQATDAFQATLQLDPENLAAHYGLSQVLGFQGDTQNAARHREWHARYKPDDQAQERAATRHRMQNPAADHAAEAVVIYALRATTEHAP